MKVPVTWGDGYKDNVRPIEAQRCVNWLRKGEALWPTPGMTLWGTYGAGPIRQLFTFEGKNKMIVASGNTLFDVDENKVGVTIGTVNTTSGHISMATDGTSVLIVDGTGGWGYDGSSLTAISDPQFISTPDFAVFNNGYFLVSNKNTGQFYKSENTYNLTDWATEFATAEGSPDLLKAMIGNHADLWLLGEKTTEVWFYSAEEAFPWSPNQSAFQEYGIAAPDTLVTFNNNLAWLAKSNEIDIAAVTTVGYQVQRISTSVIEREWQTYTTVADARAFTYKLGGSGHCLAIVFPSANRTWVYDAEEQAWHEFERYDDDPTVRGRHRANCKGAFAGKTLVGDYANGNVYELSPTTYTDNAGIIRREVCSQALFESRNRVFHRQLEVVMLTGTGITSGQGSDPVMHMQYSDDRGKTWSQWRTGNIGKIGNYETRVRWQRLGHSRDRIYRLYMSDPVEAVLSASVLDVDIGS